MHMTISQLAIDGALSGQDCRRSGTPTPLHEFVRRDIPNGRPRQRTCPDKGIQSKGAKAASPGLVRRFIAIPYREISSRTAALVRGPQNPTTSATPTIAAAIKINTARTPSTKRAPIINVEKRALNRLQL